MRTMSSLLSLIMTAAMAGTALAQDQMASPSTGMMQQMTTGQIRGLSGFIQSEKGLQNAFSDSALKYPDRFDASLQAWNRADNPPPVDFEAAERLRSMFDEMSVATSNDFADIRLLDPESVRDLQDKVTKPNTRLVPLAIGNTLFATDDGRLSVWTNPQQTQIPGVGDLSALGRMMDSWIESRGSDPVSDFGSIEIKETGSGLQILPGSIDATKRSPGGSDTCISDKTPGSCLAHVVALIRNVVPSCSGVAIEQDVVLTAAHCVCSGGQLADDRDGSGVSVFFGSNATPRMRNSGVLVQAELPAHPYRAEFCRDYDNWLANGGPYPEGDLAVVKLSSTVDFSRFGDLPKIMTADAFRPLQEIEVAGFGSTSATRYSAYKNRTRLVIHSRDCTDLEATGSRFAGKCHAGTEFAAVGMDIETDSCHGDSGAPVFVREAGRLAIAGIVSRGVEGTCGPGGIQVLVNTEPVLYWLRTWMPQMSTTGLATSALISEINRLEILK